MEGNPALHRLTYYRKPPLFTGVQIGLLFPVETDVMQYWPYGFQEAHWSKAAINISFIVLGCPVRSILAYL